MNFYLHIPHLFSDWGAIRYKRSTRNAIQHL